jgi:hypothetical protein
MRLAPKRECTRKIVEYEIDNIVLLKALQEIGLKIPDTATVVSFFKMPDGRDLEIDIDDPIRIRVSTISEKNYE